MNFDLQCAFYVKNLRDDDHYNPQKLILLLNVIRVILLLNVLKYCRLK